MYLNEDNLLMYAILDSLAEIEVPRVCLVKLQFDDGGPTLFQVLPSPPSVDDK